MNLEVIISNPAFSVTKYKEKNPAGCRIGPVCLKAYLSTILLSFKAPYCSQADNLFHNLSHRPDWPMLLSLKPSIPISTPHLEHSLSPWDP